MSVDGAGHLRAKRWHRGPALALINCSVAAKVGLRQFLSKRFPIGYEILFTPGNLDESPLAVWAGHRQLRRLLGRPGLRSLMAEHPPVVYRAYRRYLAKSFTKTDRRAILMLHYPYLAARVSEAFFPDMLRDHPLLWRKSIGADVYDIHLSFTGELHHEGDLLLEFQENGVPLYHLSFTIAPGRLTGSTAAQVLLVGRVQGIAGQLEAIRRATKKCLDVSPSYLLMAAVQGMSQALDVGVIAGVKNEEQITVSQDDGRAVFFDYDAFWRTYLGIETDRFYLIPVPIPEKPLDQISPGHRGRTRAKRLFKNEVVEAAENSFRGFCVGP